MRTAVAIVADDLTGAADAAAGFLRANLTAIVAWADPELDARLFGHADVLAFDARTRARDGEYARAAMAGVVSEIFNAGVTTLYKKMDSMLRGNVGEEIAGALSAWHAGAIALVAPAFPAMGRTTIGGRQRVNGVSLDRPRLPTILADAGIPTAHVDLASVRAGDLFDLIERYRQQGIAAVVFDAETDDDLMHVARVGARMAHRAMWVGTGGLAHAVASTIAPAIASVPVPIVTHRGPILVVVGSMSDVAHEQVLHEQSAGVSHVEIRSAWLASDTSASSAAADAVVTQLDQGRDVIVSLEQASIEDYRLVARLGTLLGAAASRVGGVVVTGGETATGLLRAWGVSCLRLISEIEPGMPLSVGIGSRSMLVVTKPGAFGDAATLTHARERLKATFNLTKGNA